MALDAKGLFAMYAIGTVESSCRWTAVNTADPITLGIMQWYGQNAAKMIETCREEDPEGYATFATAAPRIAGAIDAQHDWNWWTSFYVTDDEKRAWIDWAKRVENHRGQTREWEKWWNRYVSAGTSLGWNTTTEIKQLIYWACMKHQSPLEAGRVVQSVGTSATLRTLHGACRNNRVLGRYSTRYNSIYSILRDWDGSSAPPEFGQSTDYDGTGNNEPVQQGIGQVTRIQRNANDQLVIYGSGAYRNGIVCTKSGTGIWLPSVSTAYDLGDSYINGGSVPSDSTAGAAAVAWGKSHIKEWTYSNGSGRLNPVKSGITDCSGFAWSCYWYGAGKKLKTSNGSSANWTGTQIDCGTVIYIGSNGRSSWNEIPWDKMQIGDLVMLSPSGAGRKAFGQYRADTQLYTGTPRQTISAGLSRSKIPQLRNGYAEMECYGGNTRTWAVVRPNLSR